MTISRRLAGIAVLAALLAAAQGAEASDAPAVPVEEGVASLVSRVVGAVAAKDRKPPRTVVVSETFGSPLIDGKSIAHLLSRQLIKDGRLIPLESTPNAELDKAGRPSPDFALVGAVRSAESGIVLEARVVDRRTARVLAADEQAVKGAASPEPSKPTATPPDAGPAETPAAAPRPSYWVTAGVFSRIERAGGQFGLAIRDSPQRWEMGVEAGFFNRAEIVSNAVTTIERSVDDWSVRAHLDYLYHFQRIVLPLPELGSLKYRFPLTAHAGFGAQLHQMHGRLAVSNNPNSPGARPDELATSNSTKVEPVFRLGLDHPLTSRLEARFLTEISLDQTVDKTSGIKLGQAWYVLGLAYRLN